MSSSNQQPCMLHPNRSWVEADTSSSSSTQICCWDRCQPQHSLCWMQFVRLLIAACVTANEGSIRGAEMHAEEVAGHVILPVKTRRSKGTTVLGLFLFFVTDCLECLYALYHRSSPPPPPPRTPCLRPSCSPPAGPGTHAAGAKDRH